MKLIKLRHTTGYEFGAPVVLGPHHLFLRPRGGHDLRLASSALDILPATANISWRRDLYDNIQALVTVDTEPVAGLTIESRADVELYDTMPLNFVVEDHAQHFPFQYRPEEQIALQPYLQAVYADDLSLTKWLAPLRRDARGVETFTLLDRLASRIHDGFSYELRLEEGVRSPEETLAALLFPICPAGRCADGADDEQR